MYIIRNILQRWTGQAAANPPDPSAPSDMDPEEQTNASLEPSSDLESDTDSDLHSESEDQTAPELDPPEPSPKPIYHPSPRDILHVSALLASTPLPRELIDPILELAEYWACIRTRIENTLDSPIPKAIGRQREHVLLFRTKPLCSGGAEDGYYSGVESDANADAEPSGETDVETSGSRARYYASLPAHLIPEPRTHHPVRRITWRIRSRDQGWSGETGDTYDNSWTGFWGSVLRYKVPVLPVVPVWGSANAEASTEQDHDTASRTRVSSEYLAAWEALHEKPSADPQPDANRGVFVEGDVDEDRVWPQKHWAFDGTRIQRNARAKREPLEHVIVWDYRDDIDATDPRALELLAKMGRGTDTGAGVQVRALQRGDVVALHAYAYFPAWSNNIEHAEVMIEFAL